MRTLPLTLVFLSTFGLAFPAMAQSTFSPLPLVEKLPVPTTPRSRLAMADGAWLPAVILPERASDRARIVVESTATWPSSITDPQRRLLAPMALQTGDRYEFMYVAEERRWVLMAHPVREVAARSLRDGRLPAPSAPRTRVEIGRDDAVALLRLPLGASVGTEVVVNVRAPGGTRVDLGDDTQVALQQGERTSFFAQAGGGWHRGTLTLDILAVYSDKLAQRIGDAAAKAHLFESVNVTNDALENSGVNLRVRLLDSRLVAAAPTWSKLADPLHQLRDHRQVQQWRNQLKADGIYYLGTEAGCGLAYVRADARSMVASESFGCNVTVMRHELGHNIALNHASARGYAQGYKRVGTVMNGNRIPLYSTPLRFAPNGERAGVPGRFDAVRAMNERATIVTSFR